MDSTQDRVRLERSPTRCPYCHEDVLAEAAEWVACAGCLGRHHAGCWADGGKCAACGHAEPLRPQVTATVTTTTSTTTAAPAAVGTPVAPTNNDLLGVLDAHERAEAGPGPADWVLSPLTLFLHAPLAAEARLKRHVAESSPDLHVPPTGDPAIDQRLARYRRDAVDETLTRARARGSSSGCSSCA